MTDEENPYRFVEAREDEGAGEAERAATDRAGWDLRDYAAPADEPIFSPEEIARLGKRWSGLTAMTFVGLGMQLFFAWLIEPLWRPLLIGEPPQFLNYELPAISFLLPLILFYHALLGGGAWLHARALRCPRSSAAAIGLLFVIPLTSVTSLALLAMRTISTLRRHGISCTIWGAAANSLPRRWGHDL